MAQLPAEPSVREDTMRISGKRGSDRRSSVGFVVACVLVALAALPGTLLAQCPVNNPDDAVPPPLPTVLSSTRLGEPRIPESGYLSNTSYASAYFGFVMDLPIGVEGHRIMLPLMPPGQHALLALGFQQRRRSGTFLITASEPVNPVHEMTDEERKAELLAWAKGQPRQNLTPPDWLTRTGRFYHITNRVGDTTTVQYWTFIKNYLIRVKVTSNDTAFLQHAKAAIGSVHFYCAQEDGTLINEGGDLVPTPGEGYQGPTIPTSLVNAALADKPALEEIEPGTNAPGVYRNDEIGLVYTYPTTWVSATEEPKPDDPTEENEGNAQRTRDLLDACSLVLLRLVPTKADGTVISLRAIDQTCLGLPAPASVTDQLGAEELAAYLQMLGEFGELRSTTLKTYGDQIFAEYSGALGKPAEPKTLGQRQVESLAVTRHRKLLLVWSWIASSSAELEHMPKTSVRFEDAPPIELAPAAAATKP